MIPKTAVARVSNYDDGIIPNKALLNFVNYGRRVFVTRDNVRISGVLAVRANRLVKAYGWKGPVPDSSDYFEPIEEVLGWPGVPWA